MSDDESKLKVAGREPAVKAGGMRIVQHKSGHGHQPGKDPVEVIGLSQNNPIDQAVQQLSTSPSSKTEHVHHAAHQPKPPQNIPNKPVNNIQQPKK
ncbi:hypothetical protein PVAND_002474 [Polypedilum vanderplanki]|uniref:Death-associated protein 1 n=1 Tax=Polypedilum vanderplanki TaxID=319348 RepID=A0A9J6BRS2_POLVA|nr:hypothetical protein PVAND_002474 [Polypedilum vanderplanki]